LIAFTKIILLFAGRPTEVQENDVFLCESFYEESRRQIKKLPRDGLKKYNHQAAVIRDEIYFFRRPIQPQRVFHNKYFLKYLYGSVAFDKINNQQNQILLLFFFC